MATYLLLYLAFNLFVILSIEVLDVITEPFQDSLIFNVLFLIVCFPLFLMGCVALYLTRMR